MKLKPPVTLLSNPIVALFLIVVVVLVIYSNAYDGPFVFDGKFQIEDKVKIRDLNNYTTLDGLFSQRSLTAFSFALNYRIGKLEPFGYHLVNILIHMVNGILAYVLALCVFGRLAFFANKRPGVSKSDGHEHTPRERALPHTSALSQTMALLVALIFVAHPIQTQSVTYIVQRYTSMAAVFYLASLLFYIWARKLQGARTSIDRREKDSKKFTSGRAVAFGSSVFTCFFFFVLFGVLALLCKENAATLFGVVLLVEYFLFDRTRAGWRKKLIWLIPITCIVMIGVLYYFASVRGLKIGNLLEDASILTRETRSIGRFSYLCTQFSVFVLYVRLLFFPVGQNIDYMLPFSTGFFSGYTPLAFLFVIFVLGVGFWNIRKRPAVSFGIFWFFITLSVESSIFPISDAMFEHRLYLPIFGFAIALVYGVFDLFKKRTVWATTILALAVLAFSSGTYLRNRVWKDPLVLWSDVVSKSPHNYRAHYNLGNVMQRRGQFHESQAYYRKAIELYPDFAVAHENLGLALEEEGRLSEAYRHLEKAVHLNPRDANTQNNFGQLLLMQGRIKKATKHFLLAVRRNPRHARAQNNLGIAFAQQQRLEDAKKHLLTAERLDPNSSDIQNNLGQLFILKGDYDEAIRHFKTAVQLNPDFSQARTNLGFMLLKQNRANEAARHFLKALKIDPSNTSARQGLNQATRAQGGGGGWGPRK